MIKNEVEPETPEISRERERRFKLRLFGQANEFWRCGVFEFTDDWANSGGCSKSDGCLNSEGCPHLDDHPNPDDCSNAPRNARRFRMFAATGAKTTST